MSGHGDRKGLLIKLKRNARNGLIYFIEHGVDYEVVQKIIKCHYKSSKDNPCSYIQVKRACMEVEKIKRLISTSISTKMYEKVLEELEMERQSGRQIKFRSKSEIDEY